MRGVDISISTLSKKGFFHFLEVRTQIVFEAAFYACLIYFKANRHPIFLYTGVLCCYHLTVFFFWDRVHTHNISNICTVILRFVRSVRSEKYSGMVASSSRAIVLAVSQKLLIVLRKISKKIICHAFPPSPHK